MDQDIFNSAKVLFEENWIKGKPVRLLGVGVSNLTDTSKQLEFWKETETLEEETPEGLQATIDSLKERFGNEIVRFADQIEG